MGTSLTYRLLAAAFAFFFWAAWAWYINSDHGSASQLTAALTQGVASFMITLGMIRAVTWLYWKMPGQTFSLYLPSVATVSFTGSCLYSAHWYMGTPEILKTIWAPMLVAFLFCLFTTFKVAQSETEQ